ncbi:MAG: CRISPR-associated protein Cas4 [Candidatus Cloacimonadota bacterium]|nr:MAG: CRISPR-associated protein Cas4 [Candidatus Cloacimonadota bacterium]PIE78344.1 MAG: CRISPR-associated protein Cas4 [Candidatus Delongbacteria bacterium]
MKNRFKIYGSLLQAYKICPRQAWLMSRNLIGDQSNDFLKIGRLISEEAYKNSLKEVEYNSNKIDIIKKKDGKTVFIEVKKSSHAIDSAILQLKFYMYNLKDRFKNICGEIRVPKEKKVIPIEFAENDIKEIEDISKEIGTLINKEKPPLPIRIKPCSKCSYNEFCWS